MLRFENIQTAVALGTIIFELRTLLTSASFFTKIVYGEKLLNILAKGSIIDCCQGPKYASVLTETCSIATFGWLDEQYKYFRFL